MFTTLTECVDRAAQQYDDYPTSDLSHTLEHFALTARGVVAVDGTYDPPAARRRWIAAGYLDPTSEVETPEDAYTTWLTARAVLGLRESFGDGEV